jgi:hypothetical protein
MQQFIAFYWLKDALYQRESNKFCSVSRDEHQKRLVLVYFFVLQRATEVFVVPDDQLPRLEVEVV